MELKFREWNKNGKEMYSYDEMMCYSKNLLREWVYSGVYLPTSNENFEVMIYTGLKDCIRKEIYEGDIVSYILSFEEFIGEVKFEEGFFVIDNEMLGENVGLFHEIAVVKVIGNIYENPEMLEKIRKPKALED
ncbi:YopX family protein [Clostridioides difficile]|nr:YopX family protein [Clostridioides difficile]MDS6367115.1 YopX family protein [Clostridioides difficile]